MTPVMLPPGPTSSSRADPADEVAYARRCRQLSTYTQIATLLSTCRLSRLIAMPLLSDEEKTAMLADYHLGQEYEASGRRYYVVFVVVRGFERAERRLFKKAGLGYSRARYSQPFPGSAELWPEALREPARVAHDVMEKSNNLGVGGDFPLILSWEPTSK